jgi:hypothetical protein
MWSRARLTIGSDWFPSGQLLVLRSGLITVRCTEDGAAWLVLVGGGTMDGPRHICLAARTDRAGKGRLEAWPVR